MRCATNARNLQARIERDVAAKLSRMFGGPFRFFALPDELDAAFERCAPRGQSRLIVLAKLFDRLQKGLEKKFVVAFGKAEFRVPRGEIFQLLLRGWRVGTKLEQLMNGEVQDSVLTLHE